MATFSSVTRQHVLQAIAEYDSRGGEEFLAAYGFAPSRDYPLVHEGRHYDARAVLGVAHRFATGRLATSEEFHDGPQGAAAILRRRGFEVAEPVTSPRAPLPHTARGSAAQPASQRTSRSAARPGARPASRAGARSGTARETPPAICPTCLMALPATGVCDTCG